jgi:hypothetical protein
LQRYQAGRWRNIRTATLGHSAKSPLSAAPTVTTLYRIATVAPSELYSNVIAVKVIGR